MGLVGKILEEGATALFKSAGGFAKDLREAITGQAILDPNKQAELVARAQEIEHASELAELKYNQAIAEAQASINLEEAKSDSIFKSGWRPYIGWVCGMGLGYEVLLRMILPWAVQVVALWYGSKVEIPKMPGIDLASLIALVSMLLGFGGYRMMEKKWGVASK